MLRGWGPALGNLSWGGKHDDLTWWHLRVGGAAESYRLPIPRCEAEYDGKNGLP